MAEEPLDPAASALPSGEDTAPAAGPSSSQTSDGPVAFDFSAYPEDTLFHERRSRQGSPPPAQGGARKERRKRVDPCTFEKQYTPEETEFMNAMQQFKDQTGKTFPTHGDVLSIAQQLGYRKPEDDEFDAGPPADEFRRNGSPA